MTTATFPLRRARNAAAAAGLAAALVLTGCTGGDGDGGSADGTSSPTSRATETTGTGGDSGGSGGSESAGTPGTGGELEGSWLTTADGKAVALFITGGQAAVFETGGSVCSGSVKEEAGLRVIRLKCGDGNGERTDGTVGSVDADSLTVTWEGGAGKETYRKAEGGSLPSGLPTVGLGS